MTGALYVPGQMTLASPLTLDLSGLLTGGGTLTVPSGSTTTLENEARLDDDTRLVNKSTLTLAANCYVYLYNGAVIENAATMIVNDGTTVADPDSNGGPIQNDKTGTITYAGPTPSAPAYITAPLINNGTVLDQKRALSLQELSGGGGLTAANGIIDMQYLDETAKSTVNIGVSGATTPGVDYGQISSTGPLALAGTLKIQTATGYLPPIGTTITIMSGTSLTGTFSRITGAQLSGEHWAVSYTPTVVQLTTVSG